MPANLQDLASDRCAVLGVIDADGYGNGENYINVSPGDYHSYAALLCVGDATATTTIDMAFEHAALADFPGTAITGKSITQVVIGSGEGDDEHNLQYWINFHLNEWSPQYNPVLQVSVTIASTTTCYYSAILFGLNPRDGAATNNDASTVAEVVA